MPALEVKPLSPLPARRGWYPPPEGRGGYLCKCTSGHRHCGKHFEGGKKCTQCADCAYVEVGHIAFDDWNDEVVDELANLVVLQVEETRNEKNDMNDDFVEELLDTVARLQRQGLSNKEIISHLFELSDEQAF
jgi:hypothetical protein